MTVAHAFDRAADRYDAHAPVQRRVAAMLADRIVALPLPPAPRVLELGCGTGFLGAALVDRLPRADWWMTDLAPAMVERTAARFAGRPAIRFAVMDAAAPDLPGPFDLICSSLALQWLADLPAAVTALRARLAPGGRLAFTTLAAGSFAEWGAAHEPDTAGTPAYPDAAALRRLGLAVTIDTLTERHGDARDFLRAVKAIGAGTPRPGHRPLGPAGLRGVMARFEAQGAVARYVVATCIAGPEEKA
ncbi:methyltransferase [Sphingomonas solaris]|uniref:Methyltransferase domain-containing protein n=1 Tax=Alterirhizorhabdus solaris TaxID=2529389 RepID=A0A558QW26_9SPHN|nr:methyltransferase [Sphingomonas solaris]TVV71366.1 methyltransferase domain-containing protein [Sphingomonas solaris]